MNVAELETVMPVRVEFPATLAGHLKLAVGACRLYAKPGAQAEWVSGTYDDPTGTLPCRVTQEGGTVVISQEFSPFDGLYRFSEPPTFELVLGIAKPYALTVETGASEVELDLGGLPVNRIELKHGAGKAEVNFPMPNPVQMSLLDVGSGAGATELYNLANANCAEIRLEGGAASYVLDFGGTLRRDCHVRVRAALASVELWIPKSTAARIFSEAVIGSLEFSDDFVERDGTFMTGAALANKAPLLTIDAQVTMGSLKVRTTAGHSGMKAL